MCLGSSMGFGQTNEQEKILKLSYGLVLEGKADSAISLLDSFIEHLDLKEHELFFGNVLYTKALALRSKTMYDSSLTYLSQARAIAIRRDSYGLLEISAQLEGQIYRNQGRLLRALEAYNVAKESYSARGQVQSLGFVLSAIGNIESELERYEDAKQSHEEALGLYEVAADSNYLGLGVSNLAYAQAKLRLFDEAIANFDKAISLKQQFSTEASLSYTYQYLGETYLDMSVLDSAHKYLELASGINHKLADLQGMAKTTNLRANLAMLEKRFTLARPLLDSAYSWATRSQSRSLVIKNLELQRDWYKAVGEFEKALEIDSRYDVLRDSLFQDEKLKVQELQASFDLDLANQRTLQAEQEGEAERMNARTNLILALSLGLFLLTTLFFLITVYRQRKKLDALNAVLEDQNKKIQMLNRQNFHFTKNSLAEIVGLINMQANKLEDGLVKHSLVAERLRIETVNLLYRQLFTDSADAEAAGIDMNDFLSAIIFNTFDSLLPVDKEVNRVLDIDGLKLPNEIALSIGLITNEICINACKYVFKDQSDGSFSASLKKEDDVLVLNLSDNGNGLPEGIDFESSQSFGMQLIRLLAQDLRAETSLDSSESGLSYYFRIPV